MHHHHLPPPILLNKGNLSRDAAVTVAAAPVNNTSRINKNVSLTVQQHQRRRKKRPNYGNRTVEVCRGFNGFGFTISGQQPCRLSCIVSNSPADQAGLRAGDFLISVNGLNVSKLPHDSVVQLIGNSFGSIRMQIAENYYSDSSDEENASAVQHHSHLTPPIFHTLMMTSGLARKPRYVHQKAKLNRPRNSRSRVATSTIANTTLRDKEYEQTLHKQSQHQFTTQLKRQQFSHIFAHQQSVQQPLQQHVTTVVTETIAATTETTTSSSRITQLRSLIEHLPIRAETMGMESLSTSTNIAATTSNVSNVSAMVCIPNNTLEYRVLVGYLGTIEMPKQISHSSKLQTVRSCIRKLRQEKRQPTTTLMIILPHCLRLCSANGTILATYSSSRLNYVSSASENENRFFGLVTSSIHTTPIDGLNDLNVIDNVNNNNDDHIYNHKCDIDDNNDEKADNGTDNKDHIKLSSNCTEHITISNSCHVFVVDTKLCEHRAHSLKAQQFHIECTKDPIYPDVCLEFPTNSEYVVNLIRSMYTMRILPPATTTTSVIATQQQLQLNPVAAAAIMFGDGIEAIAHSPQPSNHSEISTTTSNSDSGIGFHNDSRNISDRIVLVNFPQQFVVETTTTAATTISSLTTTGITTTPVRHCGRNDGNVTSMARPLGVFQRLNFNRRTKSPQTVPLNGSECKRLSVRVRSESIPVSIDNDRKYNFFNNFLTTSRSCGDVLNLLENNDDDNYKQQQHPPQQQQQQQQQFQFCASSMDDISTHTASIENDEQKLFLHPSCLADQQQQHQQSALAENVLTTKIWPSISRSSSPPPVPDKLSPQVYISNLGSQLNKRPKQILMDSNSALSSNSNSIQLKSQNMAIKIGGWASLQNIPGKKFVNDKMIINLDQAISENNLMDCNTTKSAGNRNGNDANADCDDEIFASPVRRTWWSQISLRTPRSDKRTIYLNNNKANNIKKIYVRDDSQTLQRSLSMGTETFDKAILDANHLKQQNVVAVDNATAFSTHTQRNNINVNNWAISFECLLNNEEGLKTFAEFLKVEYSGENIYFWTACERYKYLESNTERRIQAQEIFDRYLSSTAIEPVNIDAEARSATEEKLKHSIVYPDLFEAAQKQIFNLMKYDSYQRFLRSDLYKKCQQALENNEALPYSTKSLDHTLRIKFQMDHAIEKLEENPETHRKHDDEDRRRKSLLPWHRKVRRKSGSTHNKPSEMLKGVGTSSGGTIISSLNRKIQMGKQKQQQNLNMFVDMHGSRSSLSSYDSTTNSYVTVMNPFDAKTSSTTSSLCRVKLPNESTTIVQIQCYETVKELIDRVLEKRGLLYQYYEVFIKGLTTSKSINLQCSSQEVIGKDLQVEYRVAFKLDLIDLAKVISVKSKPHKQLHQVMKPILQKYHYKIDQVELVFSETQEIIDLQQPVTVADGERLQVKLKVEERPIQVQSRDSHDHHHDNDINGQDQLQQQQQVILSGITNKVFQNAANDKIDKLEDQRSTENKNEITGTAGLAVSPYSSLKSEDYESDSSTILQRVCNKHRDSSNLSHSQINRNQNKSSEINVITTTTEIKQNTIITYHNRKISLNQHEVATSPNAQNVHTNENHDDLLEDLKRAQLARLEDQRGIEINIELPDFLKSQKNCSNYSNNPTIYDVVLRRPQPAPRLSITQRCKNPSKQILNTATTSMNTIGISPTKSIGISNKLMEENCLALSISKSPPPLPPKPKILPIKPSNWGTNTAINNELSRKMPSTALTAWHLTGSCLKKISKTDNNSSANNNNSNNNSNSNNSTNNNSYNNNTNSNNNNSNTMRGAYLQETSSSFV